MFAGNGKKVANDYAVYGKALAGNKEYDKALENLNKALDMDKKEFRANEDYSRNLCCTRKW